MRVFEIKYLGPTDSPSGKVRGGRMRVSEIQWGRRLPGKSYGYPHHVQSWDAEYWALSRHLGLETHDDPVIRTRSVKVQTGVNTHIIVIELP